MIREQGSTTKKTSHPTFLLTGSRCSFCLSSSLRSQTPTDLFPPLPSSPLLFPSLKIPLKEARERRSLLLCLGGRWAENKAFPVKNSKEPPPTHTHTPSSQWSCSTEASVWMSKKHLLCAQQWPDNHGERQPRDARSEQRRRGRGRMEGSDSVTGVEASSAASPAERC